MLHHAFEFTYWWATMNPRKTDGESKGHFSIGRVHDVRAAVQIANRWCERLPCWFLQVFLVDRQYVIVEGHDLRNQSI